MYSRALTQRLFCLWFASGKTASIKMRIEVMSLRCAMPIHAGNSISVEHAGTCTEAQGPKLVR